MKFSVARSRLFENYWPEIAARALVPFLAMAY